MGFPASAENSLKDYGIYYFGDLVSKTEDELLQIPKIEKNSLITVKNMLSRAGLYLGADIGWPSDREQVKQLVARLNPKRELELVFAYSVESLDVPNSFLKIPLMKVLKSNGIHYFGDLVTKTELELLRLPGFKKGDLAVVKTSLSKIKLQSGMNLDWPSDREEVEKLVRELTFLH